MSTWWQKFVGILRGDQPDPFSEGDAMNTPVQPAVAGRDASSDRLAGLIGELGRQLRTQAARSEELSSAMARLTKLMERGASAGGVASQAGGNGDHRVARLLDAVEQHLATETTWVADTAARIEQLAAAMDRPVVSGSGGDIQSVVATIEATQEQTRKLREIAATLPEIANTQLDAITGLDQRVEGLQSAAESIQGSAAQHGQALEHLDEAYHQAARALNVLRNMLTALTETSTACLETTRRVADGLDRRRQEIADLGRKAASASGRAGAALFFAVVAAAASAALLALRIWQ